ncbi:hypothetical protein GCM10010249_39890 [Streptomyces roseolilacinus]|uniref:Uncharacterized protein n=2 Tax=Streptomyces TaxID=1883 RepID=A0A918B2F7_9ACTN|nr:hypothetical protein GCM10010249_39890 [Streptomyces roseolilacinus]
MPGPLPGHPQSEGAPRVEVVERPDHDKDGTMTTVPQPTADTRWRCTLCGNLTRFDVTRSSKVVEYVHLDLAGEPTVEEREVVSETIESVRCRWCNAVDRIELVDRPGAGS